MFVQSKLRLHFHRALLKADARKTSLIKTYMSNLIRNIY